MLKLKREVRHTFNTHAYEYEQEALIQLEIGKRLIERLSYLKIEPKYILDLGCGSGFFLKALKSVFPKACIVGLDLAFDMLYIAKGNKPSLFGRKKMSFVQADMDFMPFESGTFNLVFSNQAIHWLPCFPTLFNEINRIMSDEGCFLFSTLGPDTFLEFKHAWSAVDQYQHVNQFLDMHDIGDALLKARFFRSGGGYGINTSKI